MYISGSNQKKFLKFFDTSFLHSFSSKNFFRIPRTKKPEIIDYNYWEVEKEIWNVLCTKAKKYR